MRPIRITNRRDYQHTLASYLAREDVQAYTMAILSFFALAFFSIFAIRPTLISFFTLQKQIADAADIEQKLDAKINSLLRAQESYQMHQSEIGLLDEAIPPDPQFPELLQKIERIVNDTEATMTAFTTDEFSLLKDKKQKTLTDQNLSSLDFGYTVSPTYKQGETILQKFMNLRRMIALTFLGIESTDTDKQQEVETSVNGSAYYISTKGTK